MNQLSFTIESSDAFPEDKIGILERAKRGIKSRFEMWVDPAEGLDPEMIRFIRFDNKLLRSDLSANDSSFLLHFNV